MNSRSAWPLWAKQIMRVCHLLLSRTWTLDHSTNNLPKCWYITYTYISATNKNKTPVGIIDRSLEEDVSVTLRLDLTSGSLGSGTPLDVAKQPGTELHIQVLDSGRGKQDKGLKRGGLNECTIWRDVWVLLWSMTQWLTLITGWHYIGQMSHPSLCVLNPFDMGVMKQPL